MTGEANTANGHPDRRLVINADDLGMSESVNRGIMRAVEHGVVTSASMMVNMPGFGDALNRVARSGVPIGVGLHLNLVAGHPLTGAPSLTDPRTGEFYSLQLLALRAASDRIPPAEIAAECAAQIRRLREVGIQVTHVDSHRHVHAIPGVGRAVLHAAQAAGIQIVRTPLEPLRFNLSDWRATAKKIALRASWRVATRGIGATQRVDHFFGVSLQGGRRFAERLDALIHTLPSGTSELMVHPGYSDDTLASLDGYTWEREREMDALTSPALRGRIDDRGIQLVSFRALTG